MSSLKLSTVGPTGKLTETCKTSDCTYVHEFVEGNLVSELNRYMFNDRRIGAEEAMYPVSVHRLLCGRLFKFDCATRCPCRDFSFAEPLFTKQCGALSYK